MTSGAVSDWFTRGAPAKDFEFLWALVLVLLDWCPGPAPGTAGSDRAQAAQRAGHRTYWKTLWKQARDSPGPASCSASSENPPRHSHSTAPGLAAFPHQVGVLPSRAACFQDRHAARLLADAVTEGGTAVLGGMGGVGKTQLAADYARHTWQHGQLDLLLWITAATRQAVVDAYAQAGTDLLGVDPADPQRASTAFLAWLEPKTSPVPRRWLIVLDDVADPADLHGLWPPASTHGRTLVTTRRRDTALTQRGRLVRVGLFTTAEATDYLTAAACHEPAEQLTALVGDLGHLPLALSQAAAYLTDTALDCTAYRHLLADRAGRLADLLPEPGTLPDEQSATVAAAWSLSIDRANQLRPAGVAAPMLQLASVLNPNGIPQTVLASAPALAYLTEHRTTGTPAPDQGPIPAAPVTAEQAYQALRALHRLNLIDHTPRIPHQSIRVHQIIQRAMRDSMPPDRRALLALAAADALLAAWPPIEREVGLAQALRANTTALTGYADDALYQPGAHAVLYRIGHSLGQCGQVNAAVKHFHYFVSATDRRLGPSHPDTHSARRNLAHWRGEAGDTAGAAAALTELLKDRLRVLGPDHPDTLGTRATLAYWQGKAGDAAGAAASFADLLADRLRILGPDHPDTLVTRGNLARWRGEAGDAAGAAAAFTELLADRLRILGPDHPRTLITRGDLAQWRGEAGDAAGAAAAFTELLADRLRILGPDHPRTLITRGDLAQWRGEAGDAAGAAAAFTELLADQLRVLGPDHPRTLATRHDLAQWRGATGN
ncbi:tetratricopeptide repeat protein [Streptomyces prunicolor]|uniref:tetratricopeptide repeat protein n=1 Tax=Streptomyces prunicolor TaxID=67348 RepID=UPI0022592C50|nr:tetratricopeptide repeat protein [Streptomyces prunicolor]MCX5233871.1 tetratricopeptide repeat protein [Streptomyces prunicolor]